MRERKCSCETCYYCDGYLPPRHEHDHFPVPASLRGTATVPACMNCHEWKDRAPLAVWPMNMHGEALYEVLASIDCAPLAGMESTSPLLKAVLKGVGDYRKRWADWSPWARLFYAKLTNLAAREDLLRRLRLAREIAASGGYGADEIAEVAGIQRHTAERAIETVVALAGAPDQAV